MPSAQRPVLREDPVSARRASIHSDRTGLTADRRRLSQIQAIHDQRLEGRIGAITLAILPENNPSGILNSTAGAYVVSTARNLFNFSKEKPNVHVL